MYSLIIIDDEEEIRNGIRFFVDKTQRDYSIAGEFEDGKEAVEFLKENSVDLVITDIKMTNVTGLDIMKFVYENCRNTKVIVISGYMDFNYSVKAIEYKARYYITKPTKYKELLEVFATVTEELKEEHEHRRKEEKNSKKEEFIKNEFLKMVFSNVISQKSFQEELHMIDDNVLGKSSYIIISMGIADYEKYCVQKSTIGIDDFYYKIINFVTAFFESYSVKCASVYCVRGKFKFAVYTDRFDNINDFIAFIEDKNEEMNSQSFDKLNLEINAYISKAYENIYKFFQNDFIDMQSYIGVTEDDADDKMPRIREYILANIAGDVSLQKVADHFHYNMKYLSFYFKKRSGETFSAYVTDLRMNIAKELLKNTNEKLTDVALKVGYNDLSYFLKTFKKHIGVSPMEYRQKVKNDEEY